MLCLRALEVYLHTHPEDPEYSLALVTGRPVDETGRLLFEEANWRLKALCQMGQRGIAYIDEDTQRLFRKGLNGEPGLESSRYRFVNQKDLSMFRQLSDLFEHHLADAEFKANQLAESLGFSKSGLYRACLALTGMSPGAYLQEIRLRRALSALLRGSRTVSEIAYAHGFNTPNYFTRVFKKRYGILPSETLVSAT